MDELMTFVPVSANCVGYVKGDISATITQGYHYGNGGDEALIVDRTEQKVICLQANGIDRCDTAGCNGSGWNDKGVSYTLNTIDHHAVCYPKVTGALCANSNPGIYTGQDAFNDMLPVVKSGNKYIVRRLTPTEDARLQGFPDWWVDGANGSDSNIYKMWGNGIALPCAADVIGRLAKELDETV